LICLRLGRIEFRIQDSEGKEGKEGKEDREG